MMQDAAVWQRSIGSPSEPSTTAYSNCVVLVQYLYSSSNDMTAAFSPARKDPIRYSSICKVTVQLRSPTHRSNAAFEERDSLNEHLVKEHISHRPPRDRRSSFSFWFTLQLLCEIELQTNHFVRSGVVSEFFHEESSILILAIRDQQGTKTITARERKLFPHASYYMETGQLVSDSGHTESNCREYFHQLARIHQAMSLAGQINNDISALSCHKYIPHQMAVLHRVLDDMPSDCAPASYKTLIEERFSSIKKRLKENDQQLIPNHQRWLMEITSDLVEYCESIPSDVQQIVKPIRNTFIRRSVSSEN